MSAAILRHIWDWCTFTCGGPNSTKLLLWPDNFQCCCLFHQCRKQITLEACWTILKYVIRTGLIKTCSDPQSSSEGGEEEEVEEEEWHSLFYCFLGLFRRPRLWRTWLPGTFLILHPLIWETPVKVPKLCIFLNTCLHPNHKPNLSLWHIHCQKMQLLFGGLVFTVLF